MVTPSRKRSPAKKLPAKRGRGGGRSSSAIPVRSRILGSVAELQALACRPPRTMVAMLAGYKNKSSKGFANPLGALKTEGLVTYPDKESVVLTEMGLACDEMKGVTPPKNNEEVHARVKALLSPTQQRIFDLLAADRRAHARDEVAQACGYTNPASKGYSNSVSNMSSLGLVEYPRNNLDPKKKLVQLTAICFPFAAGQANTVARATDAFRAPTPPISEYTYYGGSVNASV